MLSRRPLLLGALGAGVFVAQACAQEGGTPDERFQGEWNGVLDAGSARLRLRLVIAGADINLYSLDQGEDAIPAGQVWLDENRIRISFPSIGAFYEGEWRQGRIDGHFTQGGRLPLVFARGAAELGAIAPLTQERLAALRAQAGSPALAAAAMHSDGRSVSLVDGVRSADGDARATVNDRWHLGSITKSMTATLVARCVEAGVVSWDDTLASVLGEAAPYMRAEYRDVNFRHLMSHRAGLQANIPMPDFMRYPRQEADARASRLDYARRALAQAPHGPKESSYLYSNSGFVLAAAMLETKLGAPWEAIIQERLFAPLGMNEAGFGAPPDGNPSGHAPNLLGRLSPHPASAAINDNPAVLGPAGRVHASFDSVFRYLAAHRDRAPLLTAASWDTLHTPPFGGDYAMGWVLRDGGLWHNGSNTLWYAEVSVNAARGIIAAAAANDGRMSNASPAVGAALREVAEAVA